MNRRPNYLRHDIIYASHPDWTGWNSPTTDVEIAGYFSELFVKASVLPPARILEIGCGMGNLLIPLARKGYDVTGIDISAVAIAKAEFIASIEALSAHFICADITRYCNVFPNGAYDVILDGLCMHCIIGTDRATALNICHRSLSDQGVFFMVTMCGEPRSSYLKAFFDRETRCILDADRKVPERYIGTPEDILVELKYAGFDVFISRLVLGSEAMGDQDLLICAARKVK